MARTVDAPLYDERPPLTCGYYSYWSDMPCEGIEVCLRSRPAFILAYATNYDQTCVAVQLPISEFKAFRADIQRHFFDALELAPDFAQRVRDGKREERFMGTGDLPNFFRKPYGPGWALVGDAGYHKDPITARGISDAFRDAELLAEAIDVGFSGRQPLDQALAGYEQQRNKAARPSYEEACQVASFPPIPPSAYHLRAAIRDNQELCDLLVGVNVGTVPSERFFGLESVQRIMSAG